MVLYGLFASVVKNNLQTYGVQINFGAKMFITTWLALLFSIASSIIWLVQILLLHLNGKRIAGLESDIHSAE